MRALDEGARDGRGAQELAIFPTALNMLRRGADSNHSEPFACMNRLKCVLAYEVTVL